MSDTSYDAIPYPSQPFSQSHPDRLSGIARLLGLKPPAVETARVLELGSAAGGNLIPMAEQIPTASFVGIDLSARQVAEGQEVIRGLGLTNIDLKKADIRDVDDSYGTFDYVIAHGIYSWVPAAVQDKLLDVCSRNLSPDGVAYVSYNTLPGWSMRGMIRQMMLFHGRRFTDPIEQVQQARAAIDFFAKSAPADTPYGAFLRSELEALKKASDHYIYHDHLEENNYPCLFADFAAKAAKHGLRFLAEADLQTMVPAHFPKEVQEVLQRVSDDTIYLEQYMDFLRNRMFRQTLLVHADRQPNYHLRPASLAGLYLAAPLRPKRPGFDPYASGFEEFLSDTGATLRSSETIIKAAMLELSARWPRRITFEELCERARARLGGAGTTDSERVGVSLLQFLTAGGLRVIEVTTRPLSVAAAVPEKPITSAVARRQAERGEVVTTARHESFQAPDFEREVLRHLDGTRDHPAIASKLMERVKEGILKVAQDGKPVTDPTASEPLVAAALGDVLTRLWWYSLLLGPAAASG
jgi:methyltransferase-like protein/predicted O-methyltransferase YrrM